MFASSSFDKRGGRNVRSFQRLGLANKGLGTLGRTLPEEAWASDGPLRNPGHVKSELVRRGQGTTMAGSEVFYTHTTTCWRDSFASHSCHVSSLDEKEERGVAKASEPAGMDASSIHAKNIPVLARSHVVARRPFARPFLRFSHAVMGC